VLIFQLARSLEPKGRAVLHLRDQRGNESSSFPSFLLVLDYNYEDDDEDDIKQKRLHLRKMENEGIQQVLSKTVRQAGLILLFDGEVAPETPGARRAQPNRYPDFGLKPHSAFPFRNADQWPGEFVAVTVAQPSRNFTGFPDI